MDCLGPVDLSAQRMKGEVVWVISERKWHSLVLFRQMSQKEKKEISVRMSAFNFSTVANLPYQLS